MTGRNPKTGGRIPAQGRTPQAPGVGRTAKRHDLERPATPGLSGDLQHGEVEEMEQGQAVAPRAGAKRVQPPAQASGGSQNRPSGVRRRPTALSDTSMDVPDPIEFAGNRLGGSLGRVAAGPPTVYDPSGWLPIFRRIAQTPGTGALLTRAFADHLGTVIKRPYIPNLAVVDMNALDDALEAGFDG